ncbi:MAG: exopolyphosphatase, partial [Gammaproteobacteria bacterium CG22_combo_CG10-13_8_21_14_all_40_8]
MLAEGLSKSDGITQEAMQRGIDCLSRFSQKITQIPKTNMRIVGTNTLRAAVNAREFVKILEQMLEVEIEIVSGIEEARLIFLGVNHSWSSLDARDKHLVIDIGGG